MFYKLKISFLYLIKVLETYFRTRKSYKEIEKAYTAKTIFTQVSFCKALVFPLCILTLVIMSFYMFINTEKINLTFLKTGMEKFRKIGTIVIKKDKTFTGSLSSPSVIDIDTMVDVLNLNIPQDSGETVDKEIAEESNRISTQLPSPWQIPKKLQYFIVANKAENKLYLLSNINNKWFLFDKYRMAIGKNNGEKKEKGDNRTPEGLYFIIGRKEGSELPRKYGPLAFVLNYPNTDDRRAGKTGGGIWIHGTDPDSSPVDTRGCLELDNENLLKLSGYLKTAIGTPILIINRKGIKPVTCPDYKKTLRRRKKILENYAKKSNYIIDFLAKWEAAWETMDIEKYRRFYDTEKFYGQGMKWDAWEKRKLKTFESYNGIEIVLDNIFVSHYSDSEAVLKFIQTYNSDFFNVTNGKKLWIVKKYSKWKIYREETFPKEEFIL